eukprot:Rhum_TRINITY_DN14918_c9_g2::Rhum_TRINITY_DN14918_c9_g2_i1::g.127995::m.127995
MALSEHDRVGRRVHQRTPPPCRRRRVDGDRRRRRCRRRRRLLLLRARGPPRPPPHTARRSAHPRSKHVVRRQHLVRPRDRRRTCDPLNRRRRRHHRSRRCGSLLLRSKPPALLRLQLHLKRGDGRRLRLQLLQHLRAHCVQAPSALLACGGRLGGRTLPLQEQLPLQRRQLLPQHTRLVLVPHLLLVEPHLQLLHRAARHRRRRHRSAAALRDVRRAAARCGRGGAWRRRLPAVVLVVRVVLRVRGLAAAHDVVVDGPLVAGRRRVAGRWAQAGDGGEGGGGVAVGEGADLEGGRAAVELRVDGLEDGDKVLARLLLLLRRRRRR